MLRGAIFRHGVPCGTVTVVEGLAQECSAQMSTALPGRHRDKAPVKGQRAPSAATGHVSWSTLASNASSRHRFHSPFDSSVPLTAVAQVRCQASAALCSRGADCPLLCAMSCAHCCRSVRAYCCHVQAASHFSRCSCCCIDTALVHC